MPCIHPQPEQENSFQYQPAHYSFHEYTLTILESDPHCFPVLSHINVDPMQALWLLMIYTCLYLGVCKDTFQFFKKYLAALFLY
jgi:hypothetical protein